MNINKGRKNNLFFLQNHQIHKTTLQSALKYMNAFFSQSTPNYELIFKMLEALLQTHNLLAKLSGTN